MSQSHVLKYEKGSYDEHFILVNANYKNMTTMFNKERRSYKALSAVNIGGVYLESVTINKINSIIRKAVILGVNKIYIVFSNSLPCKKYLQSIYNRSNKSIEIYYCSIKQTDEPFDVLDTSKYTLYES